MFGLQPGHRPRGPACRSAAAFVVTGLLTALPLRAGQARPDAVPTPAISVAPTGTHGFPAGSTTVDLSAYGYTEQEFFISGTARSFVAQGTLGTDGRWNASATGAQSPYTTRLLVRRPTDPARFNGTVVVEWLNVSAGADGGPDWSLGHQELLRAGYAWVGVSAQLVGAEFLEGWETGPNARYARIFHPGDSFSYDIYSQAAKAIRQPANGDPQPLGSLTRRVRTLLADGESQSAFRMVTYYNAVQPTARLYDGLLIHSAGSGAPLSQSYGGGAALPAPPGVPATPDITVPATAQIRDDLPQPVLFVNTETDLTVLGAARSVHLQPDSRHFRMWEIAGASHADQTLLADSLADGVKEGITTSLDCGDPPINDGPDRFAIRKAYSALAVWTRQGQQPAIGPRMSVTIPAVPGSPSIDRSTTTGLAIGGIRYPQIAVPTGTQTGERPAGALAANPFCVLFGASDPWNGNSDAWDGKAGFDPSPTPEPDLHALYPTRTDYLVRVGLSTYRTLTAGFLLPADIPEVLTEAAKAPVR